MEKEKLNELIGLRPMTDKDLEFSYQVYADSRAEEMAMTGWDETQKEEFLRMQFNLQHTQYMKNYKGGQFDIILFNKAPAGRLYVHRMPKDIRIVDIALLHQFRRQGIGSVLMGDLLAESDEKNVTLSLHVEHNNPAMVLYERLGFEKGEMVNGIYYFMERKPRKPLPEK